MANRQAYPEALVEPRWVLEHLQDPGVRIVEVDSGEGPYQEGHIPGAVLWVRPRDLEDPLRSDIPSREQVEALVAHSGITRDTTVVLYGDGLNRQAAWAFWVLASYGHPDLRLLDGSRDRWVQAGMPVTQEAPRLLPTTYRAGGPDPSIRAFHQDVLAALGRTDVALLDVRTPEEYRGLDHPEHPQTGIRRLGRVPGAVNIPYDEAVHPDGRFKARAELRQLYTRKGAPPQKEVITYCRLGVRASHSWFVLRHLLSYPRVRVYDGSWAEWGNLVGVPIER